MYDIFPAKNHYQTPEQWSGGMMDLCDMLICNAENLYKDKKAVDDLHDMGGRIEKYFRVKKDEVLLGSNTTNYDDVVVKKFNGNVIGATVIAQKGDGKTQLAKAIFAEQIVNRFDRLCAIIDPNMDYTAMDMPQDDTACVETLRKLRLRPMTFNPYYCSPAFSDIYGARGKKFVFSYNCINNLESNQLRLEVLEEILNISVDSDSASYELLTMLINRGIPTNYPALIARLRELSKERAEAMGITKGSSKIVSKFIMLQNIGVLTDDASKVVLFPQMLKKFRYLVLQLAREGSKTHYASWMVKMFLKMLITDRKLSQSAEYGYEKGVLDKKVMVMVEEAHNFLPKHGNPVSKETVQKVFTTERKTGFDCVLVSQDPDQLDPISINQANWILTTKVKSESIKALLKQKGLSSSEMALVAEKLYYDQLNRPLQWFLYDSSDPRVFFPYPPCSRMVTENTKGWTRNTLDDTGANYNPI